jgi:ribonuclease HI
MKTVSIFIWTSTKAPKARKAGYQYILVCDGHTLKDKGEARDTTGNRLVLTCAIEAFRRMTRPSVITIFTDSRYLIRGQESLSGWARNGWKRPGGRKLKNTDLWQELYELEKIHAVRCRYEWMDPYGD